MNWTRPPDPCWLATSTVALALGALALAGCDVSGPYRPTQPPKILSFTYTPNPVSAGAPLRFEVVLDDSTGSYYRVSGQLKSGGRYAVGSVYGRFTAPAPADTGFYALTLIVSGRGNSQPRVVPFTLTVVP